MSSVREKNNSSKYKKTKSKKNVKSMNRKTASVSTTLNTARIRNSIWRVIYVWYCKYWTEWSRFFYWTKSARYFMYRGKLGNWILYKYKYWLSDLTVFYSISFELPMTSWEMFLRSTFSRLDECVYKIYSCALVNNLIDGIQ